MPHCIIYAADLSPSATVVTPEVVETASPPTGSFAQAKEGNLWKRAARYFGWL